MTKQDIKQAILDRIEKGGVIMKPKWHFVLQTILWTTLTIFIACAVLYLASFVFFSMHQSGAWFVPAFGARGLFAFVKSLPWLLFLLAIVFFIVLEILVRRYKFAHQWPMVYSVLGVLLFIFVGSMLFASTNVHHMFMKSARSDTLPFANTFYRAYGEPKFKDIHPGVVSEIVDPGFIMHERGTRRVMVIVSPETQFPDETEFAIGDAIVVFGQEYDGAIHAKGIRHAPFFEFQTPPMPMNGRMRNVRFEFNQ